MGHTYNHTTRNVSVLSNIFSNKTTTLIKRLIKSYRNAIQHNNRHRIFVFWSSKHIQTIVGQNKPSTLLTKIVLINVRRGIIGNQTFQPPPNKPEVFSSKNPRRTISGNNPFGMFYFVRNNRERGLTTQKQQKQKKNLHWHSNFMLFNVVPNIRHHFIVDIRLGLYQFNTIIDPKIYKVLAEQ
jgi:hypothetical protein